MKKTSGYSHFETPLGFRNPLNVKSPQPEKKSKEGVFKEEIESKATYDPGCLIIYLNCRTYSPNQFDSWRKVWKREKAQKKSVKLAMIPFRHLLISDKYILMFTRYAPKFVDHQDNLPMSMKKICDQTCAEILNDFVPGRADGNSCFKFEYNQIKSNDYGVKIEIRFTEKT